jgi:GxxExxY protein
MKHGRITKDTPGATMTVLNELKPGLDEKLYENALVIELVARGHTVEQQREYPVQRNLILTNLPRGNNVLP